MKRSLRTHLLILYVLLAGISGILVPILSMGITLKEFKGYLLRKNQLEIEELTASLSQLYLEDGQWNRQRIADVLRPFQRLPALSIVLLDSEDKRIFPPRNQNMRSPSPQLEDGTEKRPLFHEGVKIGSLLIRQGPSPGKLERFFISSLVQHTVLGASVMIFIAAVLGFWVAGGISRPILNAAERARNISQSNYHSVPEKLTEIKELDMLSESVAHLGRSLASQERLRKRLTADVAHELRTPITVLKAQLEAFVDGVWEATPERLNTCVAEIDRLGNLISEVERLADFEGDILNLRIQPCDLGNILNNAANAFLPLFEKASIKLSTTIPSGIWVDLDISRFRHVIENLLSNALRYTEPQGEVEIRLDSFEENVRIEVKDTGIGIAPEDLPHIFDRFYRTDASRTRATGGRGIGLAIAKAAVEAHGGTLSVKSLYGKGCLFSVTLPQVKDRKP